MSESSPTAGGPEIHVSAYVFGRRLCLLGMAKTSEGPVPLASYSRIEGDCKSGPVSMGEELPEPVAQALQQAQDTMLTKLEIENKRVIAGGVVERARLGDQLARATIHQVREAAIAGHQRAQVIFELLKEYAVRNPPLENEQPEVHYSGKIEGEKRQPSSKVKAVHSRILGTIAESAAMSGEDPLCYPMTLATYLPNIPVNMATVVTLANGPPLLRSKIQEIAAAFGNEEESQAFLYGVSNPLPKLKQVLPKLPPQARRILGAGYCVATARRMQGARIDSVPLSKLCEDASWELGE
jgi:hypothetical protein